MPVRPVAEPGHSDDGHREHDNNTSVTFYTKDPDKTRVLLDP